jgi:hypothetical protein
VIAVVIKAFPTGGVDLRPGAVVDTAAWRNTERMLRSRHIRPASASELQQFEAAKAKGSPRKAETRATA